MPIELISTEIIDSNPYQRRITLGDIQALADDIAANTLLQVPVARRLDGRVQLAFGHRRKAAWEIAFPGQPMPLELRDMSDRQMFDYVITENAHRQDLSAIERAQAITDYMAQFGVTQTEAAKRFNLSQSAASNLVRLLKLPPTTRDLVHAGDVPERLARDLVKFANAGMGDVSDQIAQEIAKVEPGQKEDKADSEIEQALHKYRRLEEWPTNWVAAESKSIEHARCDDCTLCLAWSYVMVGKPHTNHYCAHKKDACIKAKQAQWAQHQLEQLSAKLGIPIAQPGEDAPILKISWNQDTKAKELIKKKVKCLRLKPMPDDTDKWEYRQHEGILDCKHVALASTDPKVLDKKSDEIKKDIKTAETPAERKKREEAEERKRAANRIEHARLRKARADIAWLIYHVAEITAGQLAASGPALEMFDQLNSKFTTLPMAGDWPEYFDPLDQLTKRIKKATNETKEEMLKQHIIIRRLASHVSAYRPQEQYNHDRAIKKITETIAEMRLTLPKGWDQVPIHKTDSNCHVCGVFTSMDHITKVDEAAGWVTMSDGVTTCSQRCRDKRIDEIEARVAKLPQPKKRGKK